MNTAFTWEFGWLNHLQWLTAFPQIVSRICHPNQDVNQVLLTIMAKVLQDFPQQALWLMTGVIASSRPNRHEAAGKVLRFAIDARHVSKPPPSFALFIDGLQGNEAPSALRSLKQVYLQMTQDLLHLCNFEVGNDDHHRLGHKCPRLAAFKDSSIIVPLQESFTAKIQPSSTNFQASKPFPNNLLTIAGSSSSVDLKLPLISSVGFDDEISIMTSLQKPRKIGIRASNGKCFHFLCKPKDDLRKDARLTDFNSVINKLLRANFESRRRQLCTFIIEP